MPEKAGCGTAGEGNQHYCATQRRYPLGTRSQGQREWRHCHVVHTIEPLSQQRQHIAHPVYAVVKTGRFRTIAAYLPLATLGAPLPLTAGQNSSTPELPRRHPSSPLRPLHAPHQHANFPLCKPVAAIR